MSRLLLSVLVLAVHVAAWDECHFPAVDFFAHDEGVGISYTYALAAMNGRSYSGGYTKGNLAFVGVTNLPLEPVTTAPSFLPTHLVQAPMLGQVKADGVDVNPEACQTLWGDTRSNLQNLYVAGAHVQSLR